MLSSIYQKNEKNIVRYTETIILLAIVVFTLYICLTHFFLEFTTFQKYPADWVFQLYNALRRIWEWMKVWVDFFYFHWIGVAYLHFPLYYFFWENLFSSEISRYFTNWLIVYLAWFFFLKLFWLSLKHAIIGSCVWLSLVWVLNFWMINIFIPWQSSIWIRSSLLIIFVYILYYFDKNISFYPISKVWKKVLVFFMFSLLTTILLFFSIESGIALIGWTLVLLPILFHFANYKQVLLWYLAYISTLLLSTFLLFYIYAWEGSLALLKWIFIDIPGTQFAFFGSFPHPFLASISEIFYFKWTYILLLELVFICLWILFRKKLVKYSRAGIFIMLILTASFIGALLSLLWLAVDYYTQPIVRLLVLSLLAIFVTFIYKKREIYVSIFFIAAIVSIIISSSTYLEKKWWYFDIYDWTERYNSYSTTNKDIEQQILGVTLNQEWSSYYNDATNLLWENDELWSTYAGLIEADKWIFHPTKFDYIIFVLWEESKTEYLKIFNDKKPLFVQTMRSAFFWPEENWIMNNFWNFYDLLIRNYDLVWKTNHSNIWKKRQSSSDTLLQPIFYPVDFSIDSETIVMPIERLTESWASLIWIRMKYNIKNRLQGIPIFSTLTRTTLLGTNTLSLNIRWDIIPITLLPKWNEIFFPILIDNNEEDVRLSVRNYWIIDTATLDIEGIEVVYYDETSDYLDIKSLFSN